MESGVRSHAVDFPVRFWKKCTKFDFGWSLQRFPRSPSWILGALLLRPGKERGGKRREGGGRKGKRRERSLTSEEGGYGREKKAEESEGERGGNGGDLQGLVDTPCSKSLKIPCTLVFAVFYVRYQCHRYTINVFQTTVFFYINIL